MNFIIDGDTVFRPIGRKKIDQQENGKKTKKKDS